jgi:uncharacterized low-complexity protein
MSHKSNNKPALVTGTLAASLALAGSAFAATPLSQGYMLGAQEADKAAEAACGAKTAEGGCGADKAGHEGKCGEGRCGMDKMDSDGDGRISSAEFAAAHEGDASKFAAHDANADGFIDAAEMKAHSEGKCGEGKCGGEKKADMEGKCGEGKCGGSA